MKLIYPRCCVLAVQGQTVLAYVRMQDADGPARDELRTFSILPAGLVELSDWLAAHEVTHVAIESTSRAWTPIYLKLQQAFTVLLIEAGRLTDVKNIGRIASLFAYGLEPCHLIPPMSLQEPSSHHSRRLITMGALILAALLASVWVWRHPSRMDPEPLTAPQSAYVVRWQETSVSQQYPSGIEFSFPLPKLELSPEGVPVQVTLDETGDRPSWLELDRERLALRGTAPLTAADQTYRLSVRAHAEPGGDSRLLVVLTITSEPDPPPPPLRRHWRW
jgi:hypothetical protein